MMCNIKQSKYVQSSYVAFEDILYSFEKKLWVTRYVGLSWMQNHNGSERL